MTTSRTSRPRSGLGSRLALVVALLALVVAGSTGAWAAAKLPRNSVGTLQLRSDAVTAAKIDDRAVRVEHLARAAWTVEPGPSASSWLTRGFRLPDAPRGTYRADYTIAVVADQAQPAGTLFYCDARVDDASGPYSAKTTAPFVPTTAFADSTWVFTDDPANWRIVCALYVPPSSGPVVEFPAQVNLTEVFPSQISLTRLAAR